MIRKSLYILSLCIVTAGCTLYNIHSEEVAENYYPSKKASDVQFLESVTRPHEIVGFVTVNAERRQKMGEVLNRMKWEAAILGGDAITNITSNATGSWKKVPPQTLLKNAYVRANFTGTVVAYK